MGKDTIDPNEILGGITVDTFNLETYTIEEDSIITDNGPMVCSEVITIQNLESLMHLFIPNYV